VKSISYGIFDWLDRGNLPLQQLYDERLQLIEAADHAGFFCYHLAEHHGTPLGMAPSPAIFLAAAAARTRQIRLGPLTFVLPLYSPLRLIEEVGMLDQLSHGRVELGVGRGANPHEVACYGIDPKQTRSMFDEALAVLLSGLTQDRLTFRGKYFSYDDVPIVIRPLQRPYPPLWYPTSSLDSIDYAASHGFHFAGLGPANRVRQQIDQYRKVFELSRRNPGRFNAHVPEPKLGIMRQVFVAESDAEAEFAARAAHDNWYRAITQLWHAHQDHSMDARFSWEAALQHETVLFGTAARVREQVERLVEASGCNYILCAFAWGTLTLQQSLTSMQLFADALMPEARPQR
jgi:alkanesulfonate monooxygenase SsuD/methylene tetrahydromethanopterin reductase-like flavin-dependent oxidoreductase (luciferase family)